MTGVQKVASAAAVTEAQHQAGLVIVATVGGVDLLGDGAKVIFVACFIKTDSRVDTALVVLSAAVQILTNRRTEMQMLRDSQGIDTERIGAACTV